MTDIIFQSCKLPSNFFVSLVSSLSSSQKLLDTFFLHASYFTHKIKAFQKSCINFLMLNLQISALNNHWFILSHRHHRKALHPVECCTFPCALKTVSSLTFSGILSHSCSLSLTFPPLPLISKRHAQTTLFKVSPHSLGLWFPPAPAFRSLLFTPMFLSLSALNFSCLASLLRCSVILLQTPSPPNLHLLKGWNTSLLLNLMVSQSSA